ncbi:unnamed protein product [Phytophthora fragariaefolia]|uniref:Unnamed protein product n=1 Tax=Phytophthora fragariaefolia TaxID=1490495 RepID=A0A9W7CWT2_9STRA|nr:unnamed protein product [Phytophthora fragariaefolia]
MCRSRHINPKTSSEENSCSFRNEHTNDADRRRACCTCSGKQCRRPRSDAYNLFGFYDIRRHFNCNDVKLPKPTMSLGEYKEARGKTAFARDELQALYDTDSDADMEEGEGDEETSTSRRDEPGVGSRRPREADPDASSSKRSRSGSDRPLADACPLVSPRSGDDSAPSGVGASRTSLVPVDADSERDPTSAIPLHRVSTHCTLAVASRTMMPLRSSTLIRRRIKDAITSSGSSTSSGGTGIRRLPVEAECPNDRHSVKAGELSLTTSTATRLVNVSAFA